MKQSSRTLRTSGRRAAELLALCGLLLVNGCVYGFRGGSFPDHIRTVAVLPFENETTRFELTQEIHDVLLRQLPRDLGITPAGEEFADAIVRGSILRYDLNAPLYRPGAAGDRAEVLQREVVISVSIEFIDVQNNLILWDNANLSVRGQYLEASEDEEVGRIEAIQLILQGIVDGAQSNW